MEFHIDTAGSTPDLGAIEAAIAAVDPAVVIDLDPAGQTLRVAAALDVLELLALVRQAGYRLADEQVFQVPSTCCGGCSG